MDCLANWLIDVGGISEKPPAAKTQMNGRYVTCVLQNILFLSPTFTHLHFEHCCGLASFECNTLLTLLHHFFLISRVGLVLVNLLVVLRVRVNK